MFDRGLGKQEKEVCLIRDLADYRYNNLHYVNRFFLHLLKEMHKHMILQEHSTRNWNLFNITQAVIIEMHQQSRAEEI